VEGGDPHRPHRAADELAHPLAHLRRGFIGEGDREDLARPRGAGGQEIGDPTGKDAGLARAGTGKDQQWPITVDDRLALGSVQPRQQLLDPVGAGLGWSRGRAV
jgi:hypothetical protein